MPRTQLSRTPLSKQAGVLRASLLLSLGLSPLGCGGSAVTAANGDGGGPARAGASSHSGGSDGPVEGGAPGAGAVLGVSTSGAPAQGGAPSIPPDLCPNPVFDSATKLTTCSNGRAHRAQALACTFTIPPPAGGGTSGAGGASGTGAPGDAGAAG